VKMSSDPEFVQHVSDFVREAGEVSYRKMFGEYAVYVGPKVVALVCDNSLFLRPSDAGRALLGSPTEAPPYPGSKPYFLLDEHLDNREFLAELFRVTEAALPLPKPKRKGA
jgi:TfoX/Sxy family transcriptional regulator of competence genes